jgi:rhodanese-related sulfurtransferase
MKKLIILFSIFFSISLSAQNVRDVDAETFKKLMKDKKSIVIDLRTPDEIKTKGKIKNALELDFLALDAEDKLKKLDKKKTYLIYCAGGGRSGDCKDLMAKEGFSNVANLAKGFDDWKKKGFEVETVK